MVSSFPNVLLIRWCYCFQVTCEERYSDLEKSIYLPSPSNGRIAKETGQLEDYDVTNTEEFVRLHPCAQLGTKQVWIDVCCRIITLLHVLLYYNLLYMV